MGTSTSFYKQKLSDIMTLTKQDKAVIRSLAKELKRAFFVRRLILFGAKEYRKEGSKYNLLILVESNNMSKCKSRLKAIEQEVSGVKGMVDCEVMKFSVWANSIYWIPTRDSMKDEGIEIDLDEFNIMTIFD